MSKLVKGSRCTLTLESPFACASHQPPRLAAASPHSWRIRRRRAASQAVMPRSVRLQDAPALSTLGIRSFENSSRRCVRLLGRGLQAILVTAYMCARTDARSRQRWRSVPLPAVAIVVPLLVSGSLRMRDHLRRLSWPCHVQSFAPRFSRPSLYVPIPLPPLATAHLPRAILLPLASFSARWLPGDRAAGVPAHHGGREEQPGNRGRRAGGDRRQLGSLCKLG